jgi:hypothetical protein
MINKKITIISGTMVVFGFLVMFALPAQASILSFPSSIVTCTGDGGGGLPQCTSFCDILATVYNIIQFGIALTLDFFAPVFLVLGGVMIMFAGGSPKTMSTGKSMILGAVIGIAIVLGAYLIVNTFLSIIGANTLGAKIGGFGAPIQCTAPAIPPPTN